MVSGVSRAKPSTAKANPGETPSSEKRKAAKRVRGEMESTTMKVSVSFESPKSDGPKRRRKSVSVLSSTTTSSSTTSSSTTSSSTTSSSSTSSSTDAAAIIGSTTKRLNHFLEQWWGLNLLNSERQVVLGLTQNRNAETLGTFVLPFLSDTKQIQLHTDCWMGSIAMNYEDLPGFDIKHLPVNHQEWFVDPVTGACTNSVEYENGRIRDFGLARSQGKCVSVIGPYLQKYQMFRNNAIIHEDCKLLKMRFLNMLYGY
jgi:hypothetical protein